MFKSLRKYRFTLLTAGLEISSTLLPSAAAAAPNARTWCADRCDQVVVDWNLETYAVIKAASGYADPMAAPLISDEYARAFNEVKATGSKADNAERTEEQTQYASYWYEFSDIGWNRIARNVSRDRPQDLWQRARTFALLNVAMADAYIAGWDSKMHYDFWRPVTAIRLAQDDGNPQTEPDPEWLPLLGTPPVQDHPSTHSALGAAAAVVLAHSFGTDRVPFEMSSSTALPQTPRRQFSSFSAASLENGDSRVRAGIHFRFAVDAGLSMGHRIGHHAVHRMLYPIGFFPRR